MPTKIKKILIIEDEKPIARALELKLHHAGFKVSCVSNGQQGLEMIEKEFFDLILCDLLMPKVDGFSLLETLKERNVKVPIIILSNLSQEEDKKLAKDFGAKDFFVKSNTPIATIVLRVSEFLR